MYVTPGTIIKITIQTNIIKNTTDKLKLPIKWSIRKKKGKEEQKIEGINRKPIYNLKELLLRQKNKLMVQTKIKWKQNSFLLEEKSL